MFDVPVVLFVFKRRKALKVLEQIRKVQPKKIYILADYGRNESEKKQCDVLRKEIEDSIDWECEVVKRYAEANIGVFYNIGLGAKWVLEREDKAIFLEDDNYPEETFFSYCKDMLEKYENNPQVLWVCGTNYLIDYKNKENTDVVFTRHLLPCGWASWSHKFNKYYDAYLEHYNDCDKKVLSLYKPKALGKQFARCWADEKYRIDNNELPKSWDYQMDFTLKYYNMFGVAPCKNQIRNIGADEDSIHGGNSLNKEMTNRFCENETVPMKFPITTPMEINIDSIYERKVGRVMLLPLKDRIKYQISIIIRKVFNIPKQYRIVDYFKSKAYKQK